jgi:hypothetical protein
MEKQMVRQSNSQRSHRRSQSLLMCLTAAVITWASAATISRADDSLSLPREFQPRSLGSGLPDGAIAEISAGLSTLYSADKTADERLAAADQLRTLLAADDLKPIRSAVERRIDLVSAGIQAMQADALADEDKARVEAIIAATNRYEDTCSAADADAARAAWRDLKENEAVMATLRPVFMTQYFNHNMHVTLSESMLARFVSDYRTDQGTIAECILGAWVTGRQTTNASVTADIKRSTGQGMFELRLNGQVLSNSQGRKKPATIFTRGTHNFVIDLPVYFDGQTASTGQAKIDVQTRNQTVGVKTDLDWIPIFGSIARKIARQKAAEKRGQSEQIAAQKIANRAMPEFIKEVNERFAKANASIQKDLFDGLNNKGVGPDTISSRSSESHLGISSRTIGGARLGGSPQPFSPLPEGIAIQLHETALNNIIDGLEMNGRTIPEDQFLDELSKAFSDLLQREIKFDGGKEAAAEEPAADDPPATFALSESDSIRVRFEDDTIVLVLQTGIVQEGKDPIPQHRIEVPIGLGVDGQEIVLSPPEKLTDIRTTALEPVPALKRAGIANQIRRILTARLPERRLDNAVDVAASDTKTIRLRTFLLSSEDGWLYAELK